MASSAASTFSPPTLSQFNGKLEGPNYLGWTTQFLPILRTHDLLGIVDGSEPCPPKLITDDKGVESLNPEFTIWNKKDQCILSWINLTLSEKVLSTVYGLDTSKQVWNTLATKFANDSRSRIANLKRQLLSLHQGSLTCSEYIQSAKLYSDQLAAVGKPIPDEDLISFLLNGLNPTFNTFVTTVSLLTRERQLTLDDFQEELINHEMLLNQQQALSADTSTFALFTQKPFKGRGSYSARPPGRNFSPRPSAPTPANRFSSTAPRFNTSSGPRYNNSAPRYNNSAPRYNNSASILPQPSSGQTATFNSAPLRVPCQICGRLSHQALDCYHRMDYSFQGRHPPPHLAAMVAQSNNVYEDPQWFADSGANAHITQDLENLNIQHPFQNNETVAVGNGAALTIANSGSTTLYSSNASFQLNNVLHCPQSSANLVSIQKFCHDNDCFFILTSSNFYIIDFQTKTILLEGKSENGMYPLRLNKKSHKGNKSFIAFLGIRTSSLIWHFRLGHPANDVVTRVVRDNNLPILHSNVVSDSVINKSILCEACQLGKSKKQPFSPSNRISSSPLQLIHTDIWTSPVLSITGYKYYIAFVDDFSRFTWIYPLHNKSETYDVFLKFKLLVENQFSTTIKELQSDGGGEYTSLPFQSFLKTNGIVHRKSCPYTSPQNGLAERKLRHILETGLTLLAHSHLSNKYWVDSFLTAVYVINRLPTSVLQNMSPYSKLYKKAPDYQKLRVFGCLCYPLLRPYNVHKLNYRSKPCIFLGYNFAGYKCLDPVTNKAYLSRHVVFDEISFPAKDLATSHFPSRLHSIGDSPFLLPTMSSFIDEAPSCIISTTQQSPTADDGSTTQQSSTADVSPNPNCSQPTETHSPDANSIISPAQLSSHPMITRSRTQTLDLTPTAETSIIVPSEPITEPIAEPAADVPSHTMITRSRTGNQKPKTFPDFKMFHSRYPILNFHTMLPETEPSCYSKAASDPRWQAAMSLEFEALISNKTWILCPRPSHQHVIHNKWVYKIKRKSDGAVDRLKARLVAKGFEQTSGVDYTDTFSPVIKPSTIRVILALAVYFNWMIKQLDISNAFLHGSLFEEVYMEQPKGFVDKNHPHSVCKLQKAIYGLKQAPRAWFNRLSSYLLDIGFTASLVDNSLFILISGSIQIFMLIYVDDIIITGTHPDMIHNLIQLMKKEFPIKDLGSLSFFLGIQVTRDSAGLHLCQSKYITDILSRTQMSGAKPAKSPCPSGSKLSRLDGEALLDPYEYRSVVGALQYCTLTRPDIAFSVNQLCQHMHNPTAVHWSAVKRVLRFLKNTVDHGLFYSKTTLQLNAFCDSDWAGCPDDRRSTSGFAVFLGDCLVSWSAKKQPVVSRSSTEAEYRSLAIATTELYWLRMLFQEIQIPLPISPIIWCDNVSALSLATNPVYHARTKHIEVDYHFIREKVLNKDITISFISTSDQIADVFTKGLSSARFLFLKSKLKVIPSPLCLRGDVKHTTSSSPIADVPAAAISVLPYI
jgi:hypothetical protein